MLYSRSDLYDVDFTHPKTNKELQELLYTLFEIVNTKLYPALYLETLYYDDDDGSGETEHVVEHSVTYFVGRHVSGLNVEGCVQDVDKGLSITPYTVFDNDKDPILNRGIVTNDWKHYQGNVYKRYMKGDI